MAKGKTFLGQNWGWFGPEALLEAAEEEDELGWGRWKRLKWKIQNKSFKYSNLKNSSIS
jgi:hypothetical protein